MKRNLSAKIPRLTITVKIDSKKLPVVLAYEEIEKLRKSLGDNLQETVANLPYGLAYRHEVKII